MAFLTATLIHPFLGPCRRLCRAAWDLQLQASDPARLPSPWASTKAPTSVGGGPSTTSLQDMPPPITFEKNTHRPLCYWPFFSHSSLLAQWGIRMCLISSNVRELSTQPWQLLALCTYMSHLALS